MAENKYAGLFKMVSDMPNFLFSVCLSISDTHSE